MRQIFDSIDGLLPEAKSVLFEVPQCGNFFIRSVTLINENEETTVDAELWVDRGAGSRRLSRKVILGADLQGLIFIPLRPGDKIEGKASVAEQVHYWIGYAMLVER